MPEILRLAVVAPLALSALIATQAYGQVPPHPEFDRWTALLETAGCAAPEEAERWAEDQMIALALGFGQISIKEASNLAALDLWSFARDGNAGVRTDIAEVFIALASNGFAAAEQVSKAPGFCGMALLVGGEPLSARVAGQEAGEAHYGPELRFAQALLQVHGCYAGATDGLLSPALHKAWDRAVDREAPALRLPEDAGPTPAQVLALTAVAFDGLACRPGALTAADPALVALAAQDMIELAVECRDGGQAQGQGHARLGALLATAADEGGMSEELMSGVAAVCNPEESLMPQEILAGLALSAALQRIADPGGTALAVLHAGQGHATIDDWQDEGDLRASLFLQAANLLETEAHGAAAAVMTALLSAEVDLGDAINPAETVAAAARGGLPSEALTPMREALARSRYGLLDPVILAQRVDAAIAAGDPSTASRLALDLGGQLGRFISLNYYAPGDSGGGDSGSYSSMLRIEATMNFEGIGPLMNLVRLIGHLPEAGEDLSRAASGDVNFMIGTALAEGFSGLPRSGAILVAARRHLRAAAEAGQSMAALRLAQMMDFGLGGQEDPAGAEAFYRAAAAAGQPEAMLALARRAEADGDAAVAIEHYALAYGVRGPRLPDAEAVAELTAHIRLGAGIFGTEEGRALEAAVLRRFVSGEDDLSFDEPLRLASRLLDGSDGMAPDPGRAADWLRIGISMFNHWASEYPSAADGRTEASEARRLLAGLLRAFPELADRPMPADLPPLAPSQGLWDTGIEPGTGAPFGDTAPPWVACTSTLDPDLEDCAQSALDAAVGAWGGAPVSPALDWLSTRAAEEAAEMRARGRLSPARFDYVSTVPRDPHASSALAEALAWWGDWEKAQVVVAPFATLPFASAGEARHDQFRRLTGRWLSGRAPSGWPGFEATVRAFALRGDAQSQEIVALIDAVAGAALPGIPTTNLDLATAREAFAISEPLGIGSAGMAMAARQLAPLEAAAGNRTRAIELELMALNTDLFKARLVEVLHGIIPADLTRVCGWSHASERLFATGETDLAVTLAEMAVNRLQGLRGALVGVPEDLQLCFRDQVTDHYRWLAGLYMQAGRAADADRVLILLKDFETFHYVSRDPVFLDDATTLLAPSSDAAAVSELLAPVQPTVTGQSMRRRELLLKNKAHGRLTVAEAAELAALTDALAAAAEARETALSGIVSAVVAAGRPVLADQLSEGKTIKRHLKEMGDDTRAAALQYVILDERIGIILTTPVSQRVFLQDNLPELETVIAEFRAVLTSPGRDPRPTAQSLYALLLPPDLRAELAAGGIDRLVLSLDGPLRHMPMAALFDGSHWLVQDYVLSHVTGGAPPTAGAAFTELAGFGLTRSQLGLPALPGVKLELDGITGQNGAALTASVWMDEAFTREALSAALVFGDGFSAELGVLHLASHFKLGLTDTQSFLVLGDGTALSVADLRKGLGADLDFSDLGLLTLSACETGYGGADGAELESFAAVAQNAGARTVAATLWPVNDRSIAVLMQGFYRRAFPEGGTGVDLSRALAEAQREMIGMAAPADGDELGRGAKPLVEEAALPPAYSHPLHWAPVLLLEGAG